MLDLDQPRSICCVWLKCASKPAHAALVGLKESAYCVAKQPSRLNHWLVKFACLGSLIFTYHSE